MFDALTDIEREAEFQLRVDPPSGPVTVRVALEACPGQASVSANPTITANTFDFGAGMHPSELFAGFRVRGLYAGCFSLSVSATSNTNTFSVPSARQVILVPRSTIPPPPQLVSARFSADGREVSIAFDRATSRITGPDQVAAGGSAPFDCAHALVLPGDDGDDEAHARPNADCAWTSASVLTVQVTQRPLVVPGAVVSARNNTHRIACVSAWERARTAADVQALAASSLPHCEHVARVNGTFVVVVGPAAPAPVAASIHAAPTVGRCNTLALDISGSRGHAGRPWRNVTWTVHDVTHARPHVKEGRPGGPVPPEAPHIAAFLASNRSLAAAVSSGGVFHVPSVGGSPCGHGDDDDGHDGGHGAAGGSLLLPGRTYRFTVALTSFLGTETATASTTVHVSLNCSVPMLHVSGTSLLPLGSFASHQTLTVTATAAAGTCAASDSSDSDSSSSSSSSSGGRAVEFTWAVFDGVRRLAHVVSSSRDPGVFTLPPNTLAPGTTLALHVVRGRELRCAAHTIAHAARPPHC